MKIDADGRSQKVVSAYLLVMMSQDNSFNTGIMSGVLLIIETLARKGWMMCSASY